MVSLEFFIDIILPLHCCPGVDLSCNRNEYQEYILGGKGSWCVGLTTLPPSWANCLDSGSLNLLEPSGPVQACNGIALPFYPEYKTTLHIRWHPLHTVLRNICTQHKFNCILCTVYCVLCTVYSVLCIVCCVQCAVYCVQCTVYYLIIRQTPTLLPHHYFSYDKSSVYIPLDMEVTCCLSTETGNVYFKCEINMHISYLVPKKLKWCQFRYYTFCFKIYCEVRQVCTGFLCYENTVSILTFNTLIHLASWISSAAKTCLCFCFISVC